MSIENAMSVDVEDYFQVSAFDPYVPRETWGSLESRVCENTERLLALFSEYEVRATFFVLGWVADRYPGLVSSIASSGHEVACHGYGHRLVYEQTPRNFRDDVRRAKSVIESAAGTRVSGYRAPSYSITSRSMWALDVLIDEGFVYDASIFPIRHDRYGMPGAPRFPHAIERNTGRITEVPGSTVRVVGANLPVAGGGYFRLFPYWWTRWGIGQLNRKEGRPAVFYIHPWELDPDQPRLRTSWVGRVRHYRNLDRTQARLRSLLTDFQFSTVAAMLLAAGFTQVHSARAAS